MNKISVKKFGAVLAAGAMSLSTVIAPAFATSTASDIIDTDQACSLTITKYNQTAAEAADIDLSAYTADGEQDEALEEALEDYALKGVQFSIFKVGDMMTYSNAGSITVVYSIPEELQAILGLDADEDDDGIADAAATVEGGQAYFTSNTINEALEALLSDSSNTEGKDALETWWASDSVKASAAYAETNASGVATFTDLDQGLYLVVETDVTEGINTTTDPFFVSLPMTDATGDYWFYDVFVYPKNQVNNPTIDKVVSDPDTNAAYADYVTASEGDILDYRVVIKLPTITSQATYLTKFEIVDTADEGFTFNEDAYIAWYTSEEAATQGTSDPVATWTVASGYFTVDYSGQTMTINPTEDGLAEINAPVVDDDGNYTSLYTKYSDMYMVIVYTATVESNETVILGDTGNENDVELTYSRSGGDPSVDASFYENSISDKAKVFTYGFSGVFDGGDKDDADPLKNFVGTDGEYDTTIDASAVEFVLYNETMGYYVAVTGDGGVYYVTDNDDDHTMSAINYTNSEAVDDLTAELGDIVFSPASDGTLRVSGLEAGTYTLTEINTVDGYTLLKDSITIVIDGTDVTITPEAAGIESNQGASNSELVYTQTDAADATVDGNATAMGGDGDSDNGYVLLSIDNTKGFTLPKTGGAGTWAITIIGVVAVAAGVVVMKKRSQATEA